MWQMPYGETADFGDLELQARPCTIGRRDTRRCAEFPWRPGQYSMACQEVVQAVVAVGGLFCWNAARSSAITRWNHRLASCSALSYCW